MKINLDYEDFKNIVLNKGLSWQFKENNKKYEIFAIDNEIMYQGELWKSGEEPKGIDVPTAEAEIADFETNYKTGGNTKLANTVKLSGNNVVGTKLTNIGPRSFIFSHNFCDPTTWFHDSVRVVGENVGTGDGIATVFNLSNTNIIDLAHGKITDENELVPSVSQGGTDFLIHVYLNAVEQTETPFGGAAADYTVNYTTGQITFAVAPGSGVAITADYFYENGSNMIITPPAGMKTFIVKAEAQFSFNFEMTTNLISAVYTYNPYLGPPPAKFEYPGSRITFKRIHDFINYTNGSFPIIPAMGGTTRGIQNDVLQLRWEYTSAIELPSSAGAELRIWMQNNTPFVGEYSAICFYGYDETE